jgi:cysteine desulfurase/selenocysteine lyase
MTKEDQKIKEEFPVLINRKIVYLDNAATTQKPPCVTAAVDEYYQ